MPYLTSHKPNHTELERHDNNPWRRLNDAHNSPYSKPGPRVQVVNDQMCGIRPQVPFLWLHRSHLFKDAGLLRALKH